MILDHFLHQTKNNIHINKALLITCKNTEIIETCYNIINNIDSTEVYCVRKNENEYEKFLHKKLLIFIDNLDEHVELIKNILNNETLIYRTKDYKISSVTPNCNIIIISNNFNLPKELSDVLIIPDHRAFIDN